MLNNELRRELAKALGRPPTEDELAIATALAPLHRAEGVSLLRIDGVVARTGMKKSLIYRLASQGRFPKPLQIDGARVSVWPSDSVAAWLAKQMEAAE